MWGMKAGNRRQISLRVAFIASEMQVKRRGTYALERAGWKRPKPPTLPRTRDLPPSNRRLNAGAWDVAALGIHAYGKGWGKWAQPTHFPSLMVSHFACALMFSESSSISLTPTSYQNSLSGN